MADMIVRVNIILLLKSRPKLFGAPATYVDFKLGTIFKYYNKTYYKFIQAHTSIVRILGKRVI